MRLFSPSVRTLAIPRYLLACVVEGDNHLTQALPLAPRMEKAVLMILATKRLEKPDVGQEGSKMGLVWFPMLRQVVKLDGWRTGLYKWHQRKQPIQRKALSLFQERPLAMVSAKGGALLLEGGECE